MQTELNLSPGEALRHAMRHWVTGITIVTSRLDDVAHGMTVNSFNSVSLEPPLVTVTMNNDTRTHQLVTASGVFAVTMLSERQQDLAERFSRRMEPGVDRMADLDTFTLVTGAPLIQGGLAFLDCKVVYTYPGPYSTLFIGEVVAAQSLDAGPGEDGPHPLLYHNRVFRRFM